MPFGAVFLLVCKFKYFRFVDFWRSQSSIINCPFCFLLSLCVYNWTKRGFVISVPVMLAALSLSWTQLGVKEITVDQAISECHFLQRAVRERGYVYMFYCLFVCLFLHIWDVELLLRYVLLCQYGDVSWRLGKIYRMAYTSFLSISI